MTIEDCILFLGAGFGGGLLMVCVANIGNMWRKLTMDFGTGE